jgi:NAD(P)-dependent dehydrogenase (short-subunit alcohol dehydrogenase family)
MRAPILSRASLAAFADAAADATVVPGYSRIGIALRRRLERWGEPPSMSGQTVVVTGGTSGIGLAAATAMAGFGATVHLQGRDPVRGEQARAAVTAAGGAAVGLDLVEMSDPGAVAAFAAHITESYECVNVLVHNAGALCPGYGATAAGVERTVATQVLAPYLLTAHLAPVLWASSPATVVTVSSGGMYTQRFDLSRLEMDSASYEGPVAYARCKRAQVVLAAAWGRCFAPAGVASFSMHPGWADTPGLKGGLPRFEALLRPLLRTAAEGADTVVWLAAGGPLREAAKSGEPAPTTGFFHDRHRRREQRFPIWDASSVGDGEALLEWCAARTGFETPRP